MTVCTSVTSYRRKKWVVAPDGGEAAVRMAQETRLPPVVARLLVNRGIKDAAGAAAFLEPRFKELFSPALLPNMNVAAERIARAVKAGEKITLYGDYDVDGITGTAMLWHTLKIAGANVDYYIPHRVDEGYGLNVEAVEGLIKGGTQLLVTVDCGCSAVEPITRAKELGVDVVVSDHHEFGATLPPAVAIVHPRVGTQNAERGTQNDGEVSEESKAVYPNPDLCGAGVAFKLAWAVAQKICGTERVNEKYREQLVEFSALVGLGTIADVVPLIGENRILVKYGLGQLGRTKFEGLRALIEAAGYGKEGRKIDCTAVGFTLAPRLNAAGRMGHAREAVELLTTATGARAEEIATWLEAQNRERQNTEKKMVEIAKAQVMGDGREDGEGRELPHVIVVAHESFHAGVVGIVASRLVDTFHRPTFVLAKNGTEVHGSARSINGFELHHAIEHVRDLLTSGGGHAMAGGVRMPVEKLEEFRERVNAFAREKLTEEQLVPALPVDGVLELSDCNPRVISLVEKLEPFGRGNPTPKFLVERVRLTAPPRRVGATGAHLQLMVSKAPHVVKCIAFRMGELEPQLPVGTDLNLVVEPKVDCWEGRERVDLVVVDVAKCSEEAFVEVKSSKVKG
jgi:single-stranded-DNA-specific exonuclease